jgi:putative membrane protein
MWHVQDGMGWWMIIGTLWMVVFWGLIIGLVVWAVRQFTGPGPAARVQTPLEIAQQRYARGEITREQYEEIRRELDPAASKSLRAV